MRTILFILWLLCYTKYGETLLENCETESIKWNYIVNDLLDNAQGFQLLWTTYQINKLSDCLDECCYTYDCNYATFINSSRPKCMLWSCKTQCQLTPSDKGVTGIVKYTDSKDSLDQYFNNEPSLQSDAAYDEADNDQDNIINDDKSYESKNDDDYFYDDDKWEDSTIWNTYNELDTTTIMTTTLEEDLFKDGESNFALSDKQQFQDDKTAQKSVENNEGIQAHYVLITILVIGVSMAIILLIVTTKLLIEVWAKQRALKTNRNGVKGLNI